jgi:hypothetical protein
VCQLFVLDSACVTLVLVRVLFFDRLYVELCAIVFAAVLFCLFCSFLRI